MHPIKNLVKQIMDSGPLEVERGKDALERLGFRAAFFDPSTFSIYVMGRDRIERSGAGFVTGFERNGFFYTRSAAARAAAEWT